MGEVTYVVFLFSPVQPVFPLGKLLTSMPKSVFDGKLKKGRKINLKRESTIPEKYISVISLLMDKDGRKSPFLTSRYQHGAFAETFNRFSF